MARILFTVSISVSPLLTEDDDAAKFTTSADNLFSASSNDRRVRVEFSKKILAIVTSRREGTFLIGRFKTDLNVSAVSNISSMSARFRSFMPNKCLVLSPAILYFGFRIFDF